MSDDVQLLRRFVKEHSEAAFAELLRRHLPWVYSVSHRVTGGRADLAADVSQKVFIALARKAGRLPADVILPAWLHRATRLESLAALRAEARRAHHELRSAELPDSSPFIEPMTPPSWTQIAPLLDEVLDRLDSADREVLLLRFFQQQSHREIGERIGLGEDAARMRISRALLRLRDQLALRGITSPAAALGTLLTTQASIAVPDGLASLIGTAARAVPTSSLFPTSFPLMAPKSIFATLAVVAVLVAAWTSQRRIHNLERELTAVRAEATRLPLPIASPDLEETRERQAELLRLRGEVTALRRSLKANLAAQAASASASTSGRKPGDTYTEIESGRAFNATTGADLGPVSDRYHLATYLGQTMRTDVLQDAGDTSVTNVVETLLWAAREEEFSRFKEVFPGASSDASVDEVERALLQRMGQLSVNLEDCLSLEFRRVAFDAERDQWSLIVMLEPGPAGGPTGRHFNFQVQNAGDRWKVIGFSAGNALPPRSL